MAELLDRPAVAVEQRCPLAAAAEGQGASVLPVVVGPGKGRGAPPAVAEAPLRLARVVEAALVGELNVRSAAAAPRQVEETTAIGAPPPPVPLPDTTLTVNTSRVPSAVVGNDVLATDA